MDSRAITTVAGLAMLGALVSSIAALLEQPKNRIVAIPTFPVVDSGVVIARIGSPFWVLVVGVLVMLGLSWRRRRKQRKDVTPMA